MKSAISGSIAALCLACAPLSSAAAAPAGTFDPGLLYQNCESSGWFSGPGTTAKTRYPIVLVSGATGTAPSWLVPGGRYFYQIPEELCRNGATVYVASISPAGTMAVRGEELVAQIKALRALLAVEKVNLVGHSMGGLTSRYAAATFPEGIASVTTVASPHKGTEFADFLIDHGPITLEAGSLLFELLGHIGTIMNGTEYDNDAEAGLREGSVQGMPAFNASFPTSGVSSASCRGADDDGGTRGETDTRTGADGRQHVQRLYSFTGNTPAPIDGPDLAGNAAMLTLSVTMAAQGARQNDGLVSVCSARFGKNIGTYRWNHFNEINNLFGLTPLLEAKPTAVYVGLGNRLKNAGL